MRVRKEKRQKLIASIIQTKEITTQSHLKKELSKRGIIVNQPTLSRDLREMAVIKVARGFGKFIYRMPPADGVVSNRVLENKFMYAVREINHTGNIIIIKTPPGEAQGVAKVIDTANIRTILGTVAGDDTIVVVIDKKKHVKEVMILFEKIKKGSQ
jgi:transcriptional regulator of arginine metabolism